jgi:hypothetical protein
MAGRSRWQDGRRAWERLNHWYQYRPEDLKEQYYKGEALDSLERVRLIRSLLEMAELNAVLTARHHECSWVEIGTRLGISADEAMRKWGPDESTAASTA